VISWVNPEDYTEEGPIPAYAAVQKRFETALDDNEKEAIAPLAKLKRKLRRYCEEKGLLV